MCGLENSGGVILPKICCPKAALVQREPPHPFISHPNIANVASLNDCGKPSALKRIVGGEVGVGTGTTKITAMAASLLTGQSYNAK